MGPPDEKDRKEIFSIHLSKMSCSSDVCVEELARLSESCTGADISLICREAAVAAFEVFYTFFFQKYILLIVI